MSDRDVNSEDENNEEILEIEEDISEEEDTSKTSEVKNRVVRKKRPVVKDPGTHRVKYSTKRLSKDQLEEYLESQNDGKKRKIIIKKIQKKEPVTDSLENKAEIIETESDKQPESSYIDLAADYALPTSEGGTIKAGETLPFDWKERKISSYKKKPEGPPLLKPFEEGKVLSERYEILEKIYEDISGVLYKIKDLKEEDEKKQIKSIKEIQYVPEDDVHEIVTLDTIRRLDRMTSFLKDVDHVNLAKIYDYFPIMEGKNVRFLTVMEYIEGNTLEEMLKVYVKEGTPIPVKIIFGIMEKICDALYYLHNKKPFPIGFGDLKPSNVMMALDGSIKFINYGIGSFFDTEKDGTIQSRGTLGYAAPEQRGVDFTNTKADIFSLGITVYYMLTGVDPEEHPYEFKPLRKHKRFVSEKVQRFVDRCLAVNPDDRPDIEAVKKLIKKMDLHELDLSAVLKKKEEEIKKQEEVAKEEEPPPPPAVSQEKVDEIITDFKVNNPFIASRYGVILVILFLLLLVYSVNSAYNYISTLPRKGNFLYLTSKSNNIIKEFNLKNNKVGDFLMLPQNAGPIIYSKKNRNLYTIGMSDSILYEISIDKAEILRTKKLNRGTSYILLSKDEDFIYVLNNILNNISFIRIEDFKEVRSPGQAGIDPSYASLSPSGDRLFITCEKNESITVFDTKSFIIKNNLNFPGSRPRGATGNADKAYVCLSGTGKLAVVSLKSGKLLQEIALTAEPVNVLLNYKDTKKLYVITDSSVETFDTDNYRSIMTPKYTGFEAGSAMFWDDGKICILGQNTYLKTCSIGMYDISSGELSVFKNNFVLNFIASVKI